MQEPHARAEVLTPREREVAGLIARGLRNREIAQALEIAEGTCRRHVANILAKLDFHSRAQIAVWAIEQCANSDVAR
jgi:DNA-binding NarL/FixJ family response regulator